MAIVNYQRYPAFGGAATSHGIAQSSSRDTDQGGIPINGFGMNQNHPYFAPKPIPQNTGGTSLRMGHPWGGYQGNYNPMMLGGTKFDQGWIDKTEQSKGSLMDQGLLSQQANLARRMNGNYAAGGPAQLALNNQMINANRAAKAQMYTGVETMARGENMDFNQRNQMANQQAMSQAAQINTQRQQQNNQYMLDMLNRWQS